MAGLCRAVGVRCVVFGGRVVGGVEELRALGASEVVALSGNRERAVEDLVRLGASLAGGRAS